MFGYLVRLHPGFYMMIVVISFSVGPILFKLGNAETSPFLFTGIVQGSLGIVMGAVVLLNQRTLLLDPAVRKDIKSHCKSGLMLASVIGHCGFVLFAVGLSFVDISIAAILYNTWPLFLMVLMSFLFRRSQRYQAISIGTLVFVFMAITGVAMVILSHSEDTQPLLSLLVTGDFTNFGTLIGAILVLAAAACGAADTAYPLKLGESLAEKPSNIEKRKKIREIVFTTYMTSICLLIAGVVLVTIGLVVSETLSLHQLSFAIMGAVFVTSIGIVAHRAANLKTEELGVNALAYMTPLVTLVWLWTLSTLNVPHLDYLIIGAMGIVAANLLINVDASKRIAYKALVASLWVFGTITYFTEGFVTDVPLELTVTVFILVLAFRVDRLVRRTNQEEEWVFDMFHRLRLLASKMPNDNTAKSALLEASKTLLKIDHHKNADDLAAEYKNMVRHLNDALSARGDADEISSIRRLVDKLSHSRQQGSRLGEIVAIALTGLLIVFGLLVFSGNREIYGEITSFVLSSVVVFLFFNILDLQQDRKDETMVVGDLKEYKSEEFVVNFAGATNRKKQQYFSMATSAGIVFVFVVLFFTKA